MTIEQIIGTITGTGGVLALFVLIGISGYRGGWYFGNEVRKREAEALARYVALEADRDEWKEMALGAIRVGSGAVAVAEKNGKGQP